MPDIRSAVLDFCALRGADALWVQGAGGNVSWKDGNTLWIKASGAWLADARSAEIFVPVDLPALRGELQAGHFSAVPRVLGDSTLKPSIETALHALLPHKVVVHMHAIEVLAHLVRPGCETEISRRIGGRLRHVCVDYFKPGADLAHAVHRALGAVSDADVVFLKNHGVVLGGPDAESVDRSLQCLIDIFATPVAASGPVSPAPSQLDSHPPLGDPELHRLATEPRFLQRLARDWALYPDHVVFLGAKPSLFTSWDPLRELAASGASLPELCFIENIGVFAAPGFGKAKLAQLRCYFDVMNREENTEELASLSDEQVHELLHWDAEQYRMRLQK